MKRILHVLSTNRISGAENVAADICMMFKGEYDMIYASPDGSIRNSLKDRDVKYYSIKKLSFLEIKKVIKDIKPDIIHAHDIKATVISAISTINIPIISHLHGNAEDMRKITLKSLLYMMVSKRIKKIIYVSKSCLDEYYFKDRIKAKSIYLRNVVHYPRIKRLLEMDTTNYSFNFCYIGRLAYSKDRKISKNSSSHS